MILKYGEMWTKWDEADLFLVTTNATVRGARLVMGGGTALQANGKFPGMSTALGEAVLANGVVREKDGVVVCNPYYLMISPRWPTAKLGLFQTKDHYDEKSDLFLISTGVDLLMEWIPRGRGKLGREPLVVMPMPGVGLGKLSPDEVMPCISKLPDNVEIWRQEHDRPIELPEGSFLKAIAKSQNYQESICDILGMEREELDKITNDMGVKMNVSEGNERLQRYFLIKAYRESGNVSGAWHTSKNEMTRLLWETGADG